MGSSKVPFFRTQFNYDTNEASAETGLLCEDPSLTVQSEKDDADINTIVKRFGLTGQLPQNLRMPIEADFVDILDYKSALNAVIAARDTFMELPADVRARFHNDPGEFTDFCTAEKDGVLANVDEMRKLGLAVAAKEAVPAPAAAAAAPSTTVSS